MIKNKTKFETILDDISILHLLGVQIILVVGVREILNEKLSENGVVPAFVDGMRITGRLNPFIIK